MGSSTTLLWSVVLLWCVMSTTCTPATQYHYQQLHNYPEPGPDIVGSFCAQRHPRQCCPGRDDYCTVPILDTLCYCDIFCNRTRADCCPDFWGHCLGTDPPEGALTAPAESTVPGPKNNCHYGGVLHKKGSEIHVNCNNCSCVYANMQHEFNWKCTQKICLIRPALQEHVNDGKYGWHATNYSSFWGWSLKDGVARRLGTFRPMDPVKNMASLHVHINDVLPERFDARERWPGLIHQVADQGNCAASWAFSTASVAADRLSIHSNGYIRDALSSQNLVSCNRDYMQKGCDGGHLDRAWWYMRTVGVVSETCYPYTNAHSNKTEECRLPHHSYGFSRRRSCPGEPGIKSRVFQASPPYRIAPIYKVYSASREQTGVVHAANDMFQEREIMKEIVDNGPVQATMEVKEDFFMYKGGVYRYSMSATSLPPNNRETGFHSVRIIGWGEEKYQGRKLKYWLCSNSWGRKWGEDGYFRILRGVNESQIESFVVGMWGKLNGRPIVNRQRTADSRHARHVRHVRHAGLRHVPHGDRK